MDKKREKQPKSERTREALREAALDLFREKGFDETTMRDVAARAGVAVGASYYYFKSKEEIIFAWYTDTQDEAEQTASKIADGTKDIAERVRAMFKFKFGQLAPHRPLVKVLARTSGDPESPLSPFAPGTAPVRDRAIAMMATVIEGSNVRCSKQLRPYLPKLLWLYLMAMTFFWTYDTSVRQKRTEKLLDLSLPFLLRLLQLTTLPFARRFTAQGIELLGALEDKT